MIDKSKTYKTRDGREVRIYATDGANPYPVHGAYLDDGEWKGSAWTLGGSYNVIGAETCIHNLIEVKPRIKREVWVNVYDVVDRACRMYSSKEKADYNADYNRIACVKVVIDCEEGEGL